MLSSRKIVTAAGGRLLTTSFGNSAGVSQVHNIQEGEFTKVIYTMIQEESYEEVIKILSNQLELFPESRATFSLLAYTYFMNENFDESAKMYKRLMELAPDNPQYKLYYAQALFKGAKYAECIQVCSSINNEEMYIAKEKLIAYANYELDELVKAKNHLENCIQEDPDISVAQGCIAYKENNFTNSKSKFEKAASIVGYNAHIAYNISLCYFRLKQYTNSTKFIQEIIKRGIREHPELSVGSQNEGYQIRSVGNSKVLHQTALVETFNLKYAIEYVLGHFDSAKDALQDMPPRTEEQLDAVTLHNHALLQMESEANKGFQKLKHLIQNPPFPQETFPNLLLLYCKYNCYALAADVMADNDHLSYRYLTQDLHDFLEALIESQTAPAEAYRKFDILATSHTDNLRKLANRIQKLQVKSKNEEDMKKLLKEYEEALTHYIPVLMAMGRIYWDLGNFEEVENILLQSSEFCQQNAVWKLNMAHTAFMQDTEEKFKAAITLYEDVVDKHKDNLLSIPAMVLANLCVSYIMTNKNDEAEEWMKNIEREEEHLAIQHPDKVSLHLCIVNLVIGTLYCSKGGIIHYEFGIGRVIKSLEPYNKKIMTDTWFYSKRCFLALIETLAKHMIMIKDNTFNEIIQFLNSAATYGKDIPTVTDFVAQNKSGGDFVSMYDKEFNMLDNAETKENQTVSFEARLLKKMFINLKYS